MSDKRKTTKIMKTSIGLIVVLLLCYSPLRSQDTPAVNYIQHISVDYAEPNIVYAASRGQGLFKSVDYGESWVLKCDAKQVHEVLVEYKQEMAEEEEKIDN